MAKRLLLRDPHHQPLETLRAAKEGQVPCPFLSAAVVILHLLIQFEGIHFQQLLLARMSFR